MPAVPRLQRLQRAKWGAWIPALAAAVLAGCGGGQSDQSQKIATDIGGTCTATTYAIIGKLDHSKARIYDCTKGAKRMCVTEQNGIASDQTEVVRLLFTNALSGGKPGCLTGY